MNKVVFVVMIILAQCMYVDCAHEMCTKEKISLLEAFMAGKLARGEAEESVVYEHYIDECCSYIRPFSEVCEELNNAYSLGADLSELDKRLARLEMCGNQVESPQKEKEAWLKCMTIDNVYLLQQVRFFYFIHQLPRYPEKEIIDTTVQATHNNTEERIKDKSEEEKIFLREATQQAELIIRDTYEKFVQVQKSRNLLRAAIHNRDVTKLFEAYKGPLFTEYYYTFEPLPNAIIRIISAGQK